MAQDKKVEKYPYPTRYGSHPEMIDKEATAEFQQTTKDKIVELQKSVEAANPSDKNLECLANQLIAQVANQKLVVCKDENGWYVTEQSRVDGKLADAYRYASKHARDMKFWGIDRKQPHEKALPIEKAKPTEEIKL